MLILLKTIFEQQTRKKNANLCQIYVDFSVRFWPLDVLPFNKVFNSFFNYGRTRLESFVQLFNHFGHQLVMIESFSALHNSYHTCLNFMFAILVYFTFGFIAFGLGFTLSCRSLLDFYSEELRCEIFVYLKGVGWFDFFRFWTFL